MKDKTRKWLEERAAFGTGTKAKEILEHINDLEKYIKEIECSLSERSDLTPKPAEH